MAKISTSFKLEARSVHLMGLVAKSLGITFAELMQTLVDDCISIATLPENDQETPVSELQDSLWAEHPADRLALTASRFPSLVSERDRTLWERIAVETPALWKGNVQSGEGVPVNPQTFRFDLWREIMSIYDGMNRDQMIVEANRFRDQRANKPNW